jgi:hypothetical protein
VYYVFDVMVLAGKDVMGEALNVGRSLLEIKVLPKLTEPIRYSPLTGFRKQLQTSATNIWVALGAAPPERRQGYHEHEGIGGPMRSFRIRELQSG